MIAISVQPQFCLQRSVARAKLQRSRLRSGTHGAHAAAPPKLERAEGCDLVDEAIVRVALRSKAEAVRSVGSIVRDGWAYWRQYLFPVSHASLPAPANYPEGAVAGFHFFNPVTRDEESCGSSGAASVRRTAYIQAWLARL